MKVHITLVGGQTMPIYQGIQLSQPDTVVLICSKESKGAIEQSKLPQGMGLKTKVLSVNDMDEIKSNAHLCFEEYQNDEVSVNITGGVKLWAIFFLIEFSTHANATIFIIDQNGDVHDIIGASNPQHTPDMSIKERLSLTCPIPYTHGVLEDYDEDDEYTLAGMEELRKNSPSLLGAFNSLTKAMLDHNNRTTVTSGMSSLEYAADIINGRRVQTIKLKLKSAGAEWARDFCSPHARHLVLNAGWFEIMVAKMLHDWDKCKELWTNCLFQSKEMDPNEIDIIANLGEKLLFVECKTHTHAPTDIDKFSSVVKKYGGNGNKALFITYEHMSTTNRNTCKKLGIIPFALKGKDSSSLKPASSLYQVLEDELRKSNL